jgi:CRP-like cAMP-binding protein
VIDRHTEDAPTVERVLALKTFSVLAALEADDLAAIAERVRRDRLPCGALLTNDGGAPDAVHLVLEGEVDELGADGRARRRRAPCIVGGLEALAGRTQHSIVAATDVETLSLGAVAPLWELLEESFDLTLACLANLARATCTIRRRVVPSGGYALPEADPSPDVSGEPPRALAEQIVAMRRTGPLAGAPIHALGLLSHEGTLVRTDSEKLIWSIGEDADRVLVVLAGHARGTTPDGHAFVLSPGAIVGADTALAGEPRWFDLTATGPLSFLDLPVERLLDVLEDDWPMAAHVLRAVARELLRLRA